MLSLIMLYFPVEAVSLLEFCEGALKKAESLGIEDEKTF